MLNILNLKSNNTQNYDALYGKIVHITKERILLQDKKDQSSFDAKSQLIKEAEIQNMEFICESLANKISKDIPYFITKAANHGRSECIVFKYGKGAIHKDKPLAFLLNGPKIEKLNYFKKLGVKNVLERLAQKFPYFEITHEKITNDYDVINGIKFSWKKGVDHYNNQQEFSNSYPQYNLFNSNVILN
jgi:hypothetical protein